MAQKGEKDIGGARGDEKTPENHEGAANQKKGDRPEELKSWNGEPLVTQKITLASGTVISATHARSQAVYYTKPNPRDKKSPQMIIFGLPAP